MSVSKSQILKISGVLPLDVQKFLEEDSVFNRYIIGDVSKYGLDSDVVDLWVGMYAESVSFVLMRYMNSFVISPIKHDYDAPDIKRLFWNKKIRCISGCEDSVKKLSRFFRQYHVEENKLMILDKKEFDHSAKGRHVFSKVRRLEICESKRIQEVYTNNNEFKDRYAGKEGLDRIQEIFNNGTYYGYEDADELVGVACLSADNGTGGVLDGVAIKDERQGNGYGQKLVLGICDIEMQNKSQMVVYCSSAVAEHIYQKIGFREHGKYALLYPANQGV